MDDNPYFKILQAKKQGVANELDNQFASIYILLFMTLFSFAMMMLPTFGLILDSWVTHAVNWMWVVIATISLVVGSLFFSVLEKSEKFIGAWRRPTLFMDKTVGPRFGGLCFVPRQ